MANTSWPNSNEVKFSATGNHPTRALGFLHLLCRIFGNENHIFVLCPIAREVWNSVYRWFGFTILLLDTILSLFENFLVPLHKRKFASNIQRCFIDVACSDMRWSLTWESWILSHHAQIEISPSDQIKNTSLPWSLNIRSNHSHLQLISHLALTTHQIQDPPHQIFSFHRISTAPLTNNKSENSPLETHFHIYTCRNQNARVKQQFSTLEVN
jgi:hypothetical protein